MDRKTSYDDPELSPSSHYPPKKRLSANEDLTSIKSIVLISNLDETVDEKTWKLLFQEYGPIVRFWRHPNGKECLVKVI